MGSSSKETRIFGNSSSRMQPLLPRYNKFLNSGENSASGYKFKKILHLNQEPWGSEVLKEEILKLKLNQLDLVSRDLKGMGFNELQHLEREMLEALNSVKILKLKNETEVSKEKVLKLKLKQLQLLLKDLSGMGFYELYQVEQELNKGLMSVWAWKDNLRKQMEEPKVMGDRAPLQILNFRRQVQEPLGSRVATDDVPPPICFGYYPEEKKERPAYDEPANIYNFYHNDKIMCLWRYSLLVLLLCAWLLVICMATSMF